MPIGRVTPGEDDPLTREPVMRSRIRTQSVCAFRHDGDKGIPLTPTGNQRRGGDPAYSYRPTS